MKRFIKDIVIFGGGLALGLYYQGDLFKKPMTLDEAVYKSIVSSSNPMTVNNLSEDNFDRFYYEEVEGNENKYLRKYFIDRFLEINEGNLFVMSKGLLGFKRWERYDGSQNVDYKDFRFYFSGPSEKGKIWIDLNGDDFQGKGAEYKLI